MLETDVTTVYGAIHSELRLVFGNCAEPLELLRANQHNCAVVCEKRKKQAFLYWKYW